MEIEAIAWIPPHQEYGNDTVAFEDAVRKEMVTIWESGVTVIALSIEPTSTTFIAVMRAANSLRLVNKETAWINLHVGPYYDFCLTVYNEEVWDLAQGMLATRTDITGTDTNGADKLVRVVSCLLFLDGQQYAPVEVTMLRPDQYW